MRELNEYTAEVRERVEIRCRTQKQRRKRMLAVCVPLVICVVIGALTLPPVLRRYQSPGPDDAVSEQRGTDERPTGVISAGVSGLEKAQPDDGLTAGPVDGDAVSADQADGARMPESPSDFSFSFVWGCYGISSYDSRTGRLIKTTDSTHPEDYVTTLVLSDAQRAEIWDLLSGLELETYPGRYDPYNDPNSDQRVCSEPNRNLILTLTADGRTKTVTCKGICLGGPDLKGYDEKAQAFLDVTNRLTTLLQDTPEWQALPDYEFYYK